MDLIWWAVAAAGCLALAGCVGLALLPKESVGPDEFVPLANTQRLTRLPEYVRAARRRTVSALVAMVTLTIAFAASALVAARPTGLPSWSRANQVATPRTSWSASEARSPIQRSAPRCGISPIGSAPSAPSGWA
ncbi:hypothetical protein LT337_14945 [Mycolicibacterium fortuitum]|nr:hypothetical protein LT337_14945 [Mycolicibacterium fortuitum]